nr:MAG TPA: hypothetical protein [Bacteriophage sp.]
MSLTQRRTIFNLEGASVSYRREKMLLKVKRVIPRAYEIYYKGQN